ncbi:hypothetical protein ACQKDB_02880 [Planococcus kocurii]|uniref:hypothetical protein n=1 Tax=Planococcus kocurii TaxID=1374 RepID=UPI003CFE98E4
MLCGDDKQVTDPVTNDNHVQPPHSDSGLDQNHIGGNTFCFIEFDVNVDYLGMDDEIEVEVTYPDGIKKEYKQISN